MVVEDKFMSHQKLHLKNIALLIMIREYMIGKRRIFLTNRMGGICILADRIQNSDYYNQMSGYKKVAL